MQMCQNHDIDVLRIDSGGRERVDQPAGHRHPARSRAAYRTNAGVDQGGPSIRMPDYEAMEVQVPGTVGTERPWIDTFRSPPVRGGGVGKRNIPCHEERTERVQKRHDLEAPDRPGDRRKPAAARQGRWRPRASDNIAHRPATKC
jgi:hypothetical protein